MQGKEPAMSTQRKIRNPHTGEVVDATVVEIESVDSKPILIRLADGALIRLVVDVGEVAVLADIQDPEGNPVYNVRTGNVMMLLEGSYDRSA